MRPSLEVARRRLPVGADILKDEPSVHFRVWAPKHQAVHVVFEDLNGTVISETALAPEEHGYFSAAVPGAKAGDLYRYRLGSGPDRFPDPASRFQPIGPHGPSQVIDPDTFQWTDREWMGAVLRGQVIYELHVGTFTREGTWTAALQQLPRLRELGITMIEVMPVADFPGRFGWGYDGVNLYAPTRLYGTPDDFRQFTDRAHALGLAVILDVVYNHIGPDGNFLGQFSSTYFSSRYKNEWGEALNFDDDAAPVRELMVSNAEYWIREFHLDGLRFDATQQIFDASEEHLLSEMSRRTRAAAGPRSIVLVAENETQHARLVQPSTTGGYGLDALWNDDFHHAAVVALTGRREAYYTDYLGSPQEFVSMVKWGFLYQGQRYSWQCAARGTPSIGLEPARFITFIQNHDQIANAPSGRGERLHQMTGPAAYRAMTAFWLLAPGTPMLFQGQEFFASTPFMYFADHGGDLGAAVGKGRAEFMAQFRSAATRSLIADLPRPSDEKTFARCKLSDLERAQHTQAFEFHGDLLRLRQTDLGLGSVPETFVEGAVLGSDAFALRYFVADPRRFQPALTDRLIVVNLGIDLKLDTVPEPLLAPPMNAAWDVRWSSEDPKYGGIGTAPLDTDEGWLIPGFATVLLAPRTL